MLRTMASIVIHRTEETSISSMVLWYCQPFVKITAMPSSHRVVYITTSMTCLMLESSRSEQPCPRGSTCWLLWNSFLSRIRQIFYSLIVNIHDQRHHLDVGLHMKNVNDNFTTMEDNQVKTGLNLNEFRTYSVEWNSNMFIRKLDSWPIFNARHNGILLEMKNLQFRMYLVVGGNRFDQVAFKNKTIFNWQCPSLIIDYIRLYEWNENALASNNYHDNSGITSSDICKLIHKSEWHNHEKSTQPILVYLLISIVIINIAIFGFRCIKHQRNIKAKHLSSRKFSKNREYDDVDIELYDDPWKHGGSSFKRVGDDAYEELQKPNDDYVAMDKIRPSDN